jgi:hypothetical protein
VTWTGFASVAPDRRGGYVLLLRELNRNPDWQMDLPPLAPASYAVDVLAGSGAACVNAGKLSVRIPAPLQYLWVRLRATDPGALAARDARTEAWRQFHECSDSR